jgi:serine/threonine protein kinase
MPWQFRIIEGADQGRLEGMPANGVVTIGSSKRHAEIHLNDLYVARVHGEVEIDGPRVVLTAHDSPQGTLVNGQAVRQQELHHGDIVRMGNSHLRLEDCDIAAKENPPPPEEDVPEVDIEVLEEGVETEVDLIDEEAGKASPLPGERLKELVGHPLAHYQIEEVIGTGLCSYVFRARDQKKDQLVALKVLATDFPHNDDEMKHYVQVWKAVLPLQHPNLVTLYALGKTGPFCWLAYELVHCEPLPEVIERLSKKERIKWLRGFRVALQIGRALKLAHAKGVVHGNITARHILWNPDDKVAKLADLGLTTALEGSNLRKITLRRRVEADMPYYSPEHIEPGSVIDGSCDIYSLGVVVYALLTGRFPFVGESQADTIRRIRDGVVKRAIRLQPDIPKRLDTIVHKMLAGHKEDRYQRADDLVADLEVVGDEEDVEA